MITVLCKTLSLVLFTYYFENLTLCSHFYPPKGKYSAVLNMKPCISYVHLKKRLGCFVRIF